MQVAQTSRQDGRPTLTCSEVLCALEHSSVGMQPASEGLHLLQVCHLAVPQYAKGEVCVHGAYLSPCTLVGTCMNGCTSDGVNSTDAAGANGGGMNVDGARGVGMRGANVD